MTGSFPHSSLAPTIRNVSVWCVHACMYVCVCVWSLSSFLENRNAFHVYVCIYYFCAPSVFSTNVCCVYFVDKSNGSSQTNHLSSENEANCIHLKSGISVKSSCDTDVSAVSQS